MLGAFGEAGGSDGVDLVEENNGRGEFLSALKDVSDCGFSCFGTGRRERIGRHAPQVPVFVFDTPASGRLGSFDLIIAQMLPNLPSPPVSSTRAPDAPLEQDV